MNKQTRYYMILLIEFLIILNSCTSPKNTVVNTQKETIEFSFINKKGYIILNNSKLNNIDVKGGLLFDTGSNGSVIDKQIADKLNLEVIRKTRLVDITGKRTRVPLVKIDSLNIEGVIFKNVYALVADLNIFKCDSIIGIIGNNVLKTGIWKINFPEQKIALYNPNEKFDYTGYSKIPFSYRINLIKVQLTYGNRKYRNILFDTGNPSMLNLSYKDQNIFIKKGITPDLKYQLLYSSINDTLPKHIEKQYYFLSNVSFNNIKMDSVLVSFKRRRSIGTDMFKKSVIVIDYKNRIISIKEPFKLGKYELY